jgi:hypothetical protein
MGCETTFAKPEAKLSTFYSAGGETLRHQIYSAALVMLAIVLGPLPSVKADGARAQDYCINLLQNGFQSKQVELPARFEKLFLNDVLINKLMSRKNEIWPQIVEKVLSLGANERQSHSLDDGKRSFIFSLKSSSNKISVAIDYFYINGVPLGSVPGGLSRDFVYMISSLIQGFAMRASFLKQNSLAVEITAPTVVNKQLGRMLEELGFAPSPIERLFKGKWAYIAGTAVKIATYSTLIKDLNTISGLRMGAIFMKAMAYRSNNGSYHLNLMFNED